MVKKLFLGAGVLLAVFVAAHCSKDNNTVTGPPIVTATPTTGPGTPTVTPGVATMTPTPASAPSPTATPTSNVATVNIGSGGANSFVDQTSGTNTTSIRVGDTVHWVWVSGTHSTTSGTCPPIGECTPDGNWDSGIGTSTTFDKVFASPGTFPYFCRVHEVMMTGTVVVQ